MTARFLVGDVPTGRITLSPSGCWLWDGPRHRNGYRWWGKQLAHRRVYEVLVGAIPAGLELDHVCGTRECVNPAHLEPVTHAENVRRGRAGAVNRARMIARTHCANGHPFDDANTGYVDGYRRCRTCARLAAKRSYWKRKAAQ